jgi:signal transduction histidine kinase
VVALIGLVCLILASGFALEVAPRRPIQYPFAFVSFALLLIRGAAAVGLVALGSVVGVAVNLLRRRRQRATSLAVSGAAVIVGMLAGAGVARLIGVEFPLPVGRARTLADYLAVQATAYCVFVVVKELGNRDRLSRATLALYAVGLVIGAPIQLAAHALYVPGHPWAWALALGWAFVINLVIGAQVNRVRRSHELEHELARKERLAAIGEVTARALHHARHQMGLVGMIAHQIGRQLDRLPTQNAQSIREQLARLKTVQEELDRDLTGELGGHPPVDEPAPPGYAALVREQSARLQPLAVEHGVVITVDIAADIAAARPDPGPRQPVKLAQAFLNVLENAIVAARSAVTVQLSRDDDRAVIAVSDDGPGMTPSLLARATEPFVTTKPDGSGMGLAIARAVVEEEDGTLELANRDGGGLVVRLRLPRQPRP